MTAPREKIPWAAVARLIEDRLESKKAVQLDDLLVAHGMDSLDAMELGYAIEEQFDVSFKDEEIAGWRTFRNVLDMARAKAGDPPIPQPDRLELIRRRHEEAGRGDGDKGWLIEEVKRLRRAIAEHRLVKWGDLPVDKPHDVRLYAALAARP